MIQRLCMFKNTFIVNFLFQRETKTKNLQLLKSKDNVDSRFSVTLKGDLNEKEFFTIRSLMKILKDILN